MKLKKRIYIFLSLLLIGLFILPLIYISKYVFLSADDYSRAFLNFGEFDNNWKDWYFFHNGRFINAIFSLLPIYSLNVYRVIIAMQFIILGLTLYKFLMSVLNYYQVEVIPSKSFFLSILLYIVIIGQLASLFEFFYWYAAVTVYLFSFIFFVLFLQLILKFYFNNELKFLSIAILIVLMNGNNEILLGLTNFLILVLLIWDTMKFRELNNKLLFLNIISWISSLAVVLSPGTLVRRGQYNYGGDFFGSIKVAIIYGGKFIVNNLFELPVLIFFALVFLVVYQKTKEEEKRSINPFFLLIISYISVSSLFFIIYYSRGLLGVNTGRIGNIVNLVVLVFILLNVINIAVYLRQIDKYVKLNLPYLFGVLAMILLSFFLFKDRNYRDVRKDFLENKFVEYEQEMENRISLLKEASGDSVALKFLDGTRVLKSYDRLLIKQEWLQEHFLKYYNKKNKTALHYVKIIDNENPDVN